MNAKRLINDWRKTSLALPLMVTIMLAVAIAGFSVYHIGTYKMPDTMSSKAVTAFELKERFDQLLTSARQMERDEKSIDIAKLITDAQLFDYEFMRLDAPDYIGIIEENGLQAQFDKVSVLADRIDALVEIMEVFEGFTNALLPLVRGRNTDKVRRVTQFASRLRKGRGSGS